MLTLFLVVQTAALLYLCTKVCCLEIKPDDKELVLAEGSSVALICSSSGSTTWEFKREDVPYFQMEQIQNGRQSYQIVQTDATSSVLTLWNVSWKHTGVYQCVDALNGETKEVAVFVPGLFLISSFVVRSILNVAWYLIKWVIWLVPDPEVWFVESAHGMVTKTSEESTIPCVVTNPNITVTLYEKDTDMPIKGRYVPSEGYKAPLEDRTYACRGELNGEVKDSQAFYVFSIVGKCSGQKVSWQTVLRSWVIKISEST